MSSVLQVTIRGHSPETEHLKMAMRDPSTIVAKWQRNLTQAQTSMMEGADAVTESPGVAAANKFAKWQAAMQNPDVQNKWRQKTAAVTVEQWRTAYKTKAPQRIAAGVTAAIGKYTTAMTALLQYEQAGLNTLKGMADVNDADTDARMLFWKNYMSKYKG